MKIQKKSYYVCHLEYYVVWCGSSFECAGGCYGNRSAKVSVKVHSSADSV